MPCWAAQVMARVRKAPVLARHGGQRGVDGEQPGGLVPVGGVVVLAAEQAVIDPGHVRDTGVESWRHRASPEFSVTSPMAPIVARSASSRPAGSLGGP